MTLAKIGDNDSGNVNYKEKEHNNKAPCEINVQIMCKPVAILTLSFSLVN